MMNAKGISLAVAAVALMTPVLSAPAHALVREGIYAGGAGGVTFPNDADTSFSGGTNNLESDPGWVVNGSVGYAWGNGLRTEAELGYRTADIDRITGAGAGPAQDGEFRVLNAMGNVLYDIDLNMFFGEDAQPLASWITPYIGGGIGYAHMEADGIRQAITGATIDGDEGQFAWQAIAGFSVDLDYNWSLTADYRYFDVMDADFDTSTPGVKANTEYSSHNIMVGVRYTFGEPTPVSAPRQVRMPTVAPVRQAATPTQAQTYMVFFDWNRSDLTPEAKQVLATIASEIKKGNRVKVNVVGHADTSGSTQYNVGLSNRRASTVKGELVANGVPDSMIVTRGAGESELLVPTADGVREAQNRRAEIVFDGK